MLSVYLGLQTASFIHNYFFYNILMTNKSSS